MALPRNGNGSLKTWIVRVAAGIVVGAVLGCAAGIIRNGNRITALETHIPYIRDALDRIEKRLNEARR